MKEIRLYGKMGEQFGRSHMLNVKTPAEAIRALMATRKGFRRFVYEHRDAPYRVWSGPRVVTTETIGLPCGKESVIRIAPITSGAGGKDLLGILIGAALIIFAPEIGFAIGSGTGGVISGLTAANLAGSLGWAMVLGGVSSLLAPKVNAEQNTPVDEKASFVFDGPVNVTRQGGPVPIVYGRLKIGSTTVSAGVNTEQIIPDGASVDLLAGVHFWDWAF